MIIDLKKITKLVYKDITKNKNLPEKVEVQVVVPILYHSKDRDTIVVLNGEDYIADKDKITFVFKHKGIKFFIDDDWHDYKGAKDAKSIYKYLQHYKQIRYEDKSGWCAVWYKFI